MALWEWLAVGAAGLFLHSQAKKNAAEQKHEEEEVNAFLRDIEKESQKRAQEHAEWERKWEQERAESERRRKVNQTRRQMPCLFIGEPSPSAFKTLASEVASQFARIKSISVHGAVVYATVESQTGLSDWEFNVDFNNWGHIDGTYWTRSENDDSSIPKHFGKTLSGKVCEYLRNCDIVVPDFSDVVDANTALGTDDGLDTHYREGFVRKLFRGGVQCINIEYDADYFYGEHIYPVISLLKQAGFVNIKSIPIEDVDNKTHHYVYEVDKISIAGTTDFHYGYAFPHNAEVVIYYHSKRRIVMPASESKFRRKNYVAVGDYLQELGFTEIYERKINDLVVGLITKDGSVENVFVDDGEETPIVQGKPYYYDTKIVICYYTYK